MSPKQLLRKLLKRETLCETIACWFVVFAGGGFLILYVAGIAAEASYAARDVSRISFSLGLLLILVVLSGVRLYRSSATYLTVYKNALRNVPTPVLITDNAAIVLHANNAARALMEIDETCDLGQFNIRHLIDDDGNISEKHWPHKGELWLISGDRLERAGKCLGYLISLNREKPAGDCGERKQIYNDAIILINSLIEITEFTNCYADTVSELAHLLNSVASSDPSQRINEDIVEIIRNLNEDMQEKLDNNQAEIDVILRTLGRLNPSAKR